MNQSINSASLWSKQGLIPSSDKLKLPISATKVVDNSSSGGDVCGDSNDYIMSSQLLKSKQTNDLYDGNGNSMGNINLLNSSNSSGGGGGGNGSIVMNGNAFDEMLMANSSCNNMPTDITRSMTQYNSKLPITPNSKLIDFKCFGDVESNYLTHSDSAQPATHSIMNPNNPSESSVLMKLFQQQNSTQVRPEDHYLWFYLDPRRVVQGPFHDSQMFQWWSQGIYFQNSLLMKRKCDADFSTLQEYSKRFNGVPFNRKDIHIPPLIKSLTSVMGVMESTSSANFRPPQSTNSVQQSVASTLTSSQSTASGTISNTTQSPSSDSLILKLLSHNTSPPDDIAKLLQKFSFSQPQHVSQASNQIDAYHMSNGGNVVDNQQHHQHHNRFINQTDDSYNTLSQSNWPTSTNLKSSQATLTDNVWNSNVGNKDLILMSSSTWSSNHHDIPAPITSSPPLPPPMSSSGWENLIDPAIIKIGRANDYNAGNVVASSLSSSSSLLSSSPNHNNSINAHAGNATTSSVINTGGNTSAAAWAELVRKTHTPPNNNNNSNNNQISSNSNAKSAGRRFSSDNHDIYSHHTSVPPGPIGTIPYSKSNEIQQQQRLDKDELDKQNERKRSDSCDKELTSLINWCKGYLENKPAFKQVDIATLAELLFAIESPYEVEAMLNENVPNFDNSSEFVQQFLEKRRPVRQKLLAIDTNPAEILAVHHNSLSSSAPTTNTGGHSNDGHLHNSSIQPQNSSSISVSVDCNTLITTASPSNNNNNNNKWQVKSRHHPAGSGTTSRRKKNVAATARNNHSNNTTSNKKQSTDYYYQ